MAKKYEAFWSLTTKTRPRLGFTHDMLYRIKDGERYLERWILWLGPLGSMRVHRFWSSDDERAVHDHPWWFVTFPFQSYWELVPKTDSCWAGVDYRLTKRFRFHYRRASFAYKHIVLVHNPGRTWSFVITGRPRHQWGFYPRPACNQFIPWKQWLGIDNG